MSDPATAAPPTPRVYLIHRQPDKPRAEAIARGLRERGIDCWFDGWEILGGDNFVQRMEDGLHRAHGGLVLLSESGIGEGSWSYEEFSALLRRVVEERHGTLRPFIIPLLAGACPDMPEFLKTRHPLAADDIDPIAQAILRHTGHLGPAAPPLGPLAVLPPVERLVLELERAGDECIARLAGQEERSPLSATRLQALLAPHPVPGPVRDQGGSEGPAGEVLERLDRLGHDLAALLGRGDTLRTTLAARLDPQRHPHAGETALILRSADPDLLSLRWETLRLGTLPALGLLPGTTIVREVLGTPARRYAIPGPLRVLVATAAPAGDLDQEHESQVILEALDDLAQTGARVAFAENGATLQAIGEQLDAGGFHVLHLSAHGTPGLLWLEDEAGQPQAVTPAELGQVLLSSRHPPPLVVLSACWSGATATAAAIGTAAGAAATAGPDEPVHMACALIAQGVPAVIAMQQPVGDGYATELARHFYLALARAPSCDPQPAAALAVARQRVEQERRAAAQRGQLYRAPLPEFGTPAAYAACEAGLAPLYDGRQPAELRAGAAPLVGVPGLPQRPVGYLVGRRVLRRQLRAQVVPHGRAGALLRGAGGAGKSSLAMQLGLGLRREGWLVAVVVGDAALAVIAAQVGQAFAEQGRDCKLSPDGQARCRALQAAAPRSEADTLADLRVLLANEPVLVLLDNFETNQLPPLQPAPPAPHSPAAALPEQLEPGAVSLRSDIARLLPKLAAAAMRGALVLTGRYSVPQAGNRLVPLDVGAPLTDIEVRRFLWRLPGLQARPAAERERILTLLGGHPRALEFADALLRARAPAGAIERCFEDIPRRMTELAERRGESWDEGVESQEDAAALARRRIAEDVLLEALLGRLTAEEQAFLRAAAVFRRGVPLEALHAVAGPCGLDWQRPRVRQAITRLEALTLLVPTGPLHRPGAAAAKPGQSWLVHRWTAASLAQTCPPRAEAHRAAAAFWHAGDAPDWEDAWEAVAHRLAAGDVDAANELALKMYFGAKERGWAAAALAVAEQLAASLPSEDVRRFSWWGESIDELAALGQGDPALARARDVCRAIETSFEGASDDRKLQHTLSVLYNKLGDLHRNLGNWLEALRLYQFTLEIRDRLASREPDSFDNQRNLSVSYEKLGNLQRDMGNGLEALRLYQLNLDIADWLAQCEPDRTDYQRDLAVSYEKLADLQQDLGNGSEAQRLYALGLEIRDRLARREPDRADYQQDLAVSYEKLGDFDRCLYQFALDLRDRLVQCEADGADLQHDLALSSSKLDDLERDLGDGPEALRLYQFALEIRERLARREPDRVDYQRDLAGSYQRMATVTQGAQAQDWIRRAVQICRQVLARNPAQAVLQRDLALALYHQAQLCQDPASRAEAARLLGALKQRGALEARFHSLADELAAAGDHTGTP